MRTAASKLCGFLAILLFATAATAQPMRCDVNGDGHVTLAEVYVCMTLCIGNACKSFNAAPTANAGPDQTTILGATVQLSAAKSTDPDGPQPLSYAWRLKDRPRGSHAFLAGAGTLRPTFVVDVPGRYVVGLTVHDGLASGTDEVVVSTGNSAPVANAGADQSVFVGDVARLSGAGSTDVDGDPLAFAWTLLAKPPASNASLQRIRPVRDDPVDLAIDVEGTYIVQLVVSDGQLASGPDLVVITTGNTRPVANPKASCAPVPNADCSAPVGSTMSLDGSASTDVDGDPLTYAWTLLSRPPGSAATLSTPASVMSGFVNDAPGAFVVQLIVNDGHAASAARTLNVSSTNASPVAVATAIPVAIAALPQLVQLDGTGSMDPEGQGLALAWSLIAKPAGSAAVLSSTTAAQPTFVADLVGTYTAQLIVNDGFLASVPVTASVSTVNQAPNASAGPDQSVVAGTVVQLTSAGSSDPEGSPLGYFWSLLNRPAGSVADFGNANAAHPTLPADRKGTYVAQLIVNDGALDSAPDTVQVTAINRPPVAVADSYTVAENGSLAIGAAAGVLANDSDADGDPLTAILVGAAPTGFALNANGGFTYSPPAGFNGVTTFQYRANDGTADSSAVTATITVTPAVTPTVTIAATTPNASETGLAPGLVTFTRTGPTAVALIVSFSIGGNATNGVDYVGIGGSVTIPAGQASVTLNVTPIADPLVEGDETVMLAIAPDPTRYLIGSPGSATVTLGDGLANVVSIAAGTANASETGQVPGVFTFTRTGPLAFAVTVSFSIGGNATNGVDYVGMGGSVTIPAGQASVTLNVTPIADPNIEGDETVIVSIAPDPTRYLIGSPSSTTVTIGDAVANVVTLAATAPSASEMGPVSGQFTFTRTGPAAFPLIVSFGIGGSATNGADYSAIGGSATIPAGQSSVTLSITPIADALIDAGETVILTIAPNPTAYVIGAPNSATVTID